MPVFSLPCILLVQLASLNYILVSCYSFLPLNFHGEGGLWQEECAGILFRRLFLLLKFHVWAAQCSCCLSLQLCHQSTWAWQPERQACGEQYSHLVDQLQAFQKNDILKLCSPRQTIWAPTAQPADWFAFRVHTQPSYFLLADPLKGYETSRAPMCLLNQVQWKPSTGWFVYIFKGF